MWLEVNSLAKVMEENVMEWLLIEFRVRNNRNGGKIVEVGGLVSCCGFREGNKWT